uniref:Uncharacterized protein n=1 Tax=Nelumbo nucifera TaxID=4432 RepID=A0A822XPY4_NELNU|nr:TPA_asm: hypothetical protein HUJ06_022612 [Nelumbo nucifera]
MGRISSVSLLPTSNTRKQRIDKKKIERDKHRESRDWPYLSRMWPESEIDCCKEKPSRVRFARGVNPRLRSVKMK